MGHDYGSAAVTQHIDRCGEHGRLQDHSHSFLRQAYKVIESLLFMGAAH